MPMARAEHAYQENAIRSADSLQLVVMLHDMLIGDLTRAIAATQASDVQRRSDELKHAFAVIEQLQGTLNMDSGGDAALNMDRLYVIARSRLLQAHVTADVTVMKEQLQIFDSLRQAWTSLLRPTSVTNVDPIVSADQQPSTRNWSV